MAKKKRVKRKKGGPTQGRSQSSAGRASHSRPARGRWRNADSAVAGVALVLLLPPFFFVPGLADSFRLPKLLSSETLALVSIALLATRLWGQGRLRPSRDLFEPLSRRLALWALAPLVLLATLGLATSPYPVHVRQALPSLFIGAATLVAWSVGIGVDERRRLLRLLAVPATALALLAILQFHGLSTPFLFEGRVSERLALTSLAGGAFDLAAYLVLPVLVAVVSAWWAPTSGWRKLWLGVGALCAYAIFITSTVTAILALLAGLGVLAWRLLPRRKVVAGLGVLLVASIVAASVGPLAPRIQTKSKALLAGDVDRVLTGRLDGWRTAVHMAREEPITGVGLGGYRPAFGPARLALREAGVKFYRGQHRAYFVNAHSDPLEVLGELGVPGLLALLWATGLVVVGVRRGFRPPSSARTPSAAPGRSSRGFPSSGGLAEADDPRDLAERSLELAALPALALLSAAYFPFHLALVAYPWLLLLSGPLGRPEPVVDEAMVDAAMVDEAEADGSAAGEAQADGSAAGGSVADGAEADLAASPGPSTSPDPSTAPSAPTTWPSKAVAGVLVAFFVVAAGVRFEQVRQRLGADRIAHATEAAVKQAVAAGRQPSPRALRSQVEMLERAATLDPTNVSIPMSIGAHYFLMQRWPEACRAFAQAAQLEMRGEVYANLARCHLAAGDREAGMEAARKAILLDNTQRKYFASELAEPAERRPGSGPGVGGTPGNVRPEADSGSETSS